MKISDELGCVVDSQIDLTPALIKRCLTYRRGMPLRERWFKDKKCVSCGHQPTREDFKDDFSLNYFRVVRICHFCQERIFG